VKYCRRWGGGRGRLRWWITLLSRIAGEGGMVMIRELPRTRGASSAEAWSDGAFEPVIP
jgi:hypothetical protein